MTLDLSFEDLKRVALDGRVVKNGITLTVGRPLIPDEETDASGKLGEVRFTVDDTQFRTHRLWLVKPASTSRADGFQKGRHLGSATSEASPAILSPPTLGGDTVRISVQDQRTQPGSSR